MSNLKNPYYTKQIITYLGNKRLLLKEIETLLEKVKRKLKKEKLVSADLFSGSGVVSRLLKKHSSLVIANDLENYSKIINECFLSNKEEFDSLMFNKYLKDMNEMIESNPIEGIISNNYAPKDDNNIQKNERVFYTRENALYIDSFRHYMDDIIPQELKFFLAQLLTEASIHVNTSGVFKGFYKDKKTGIGKFGGTDEYALSRIKSKIKIEEPVLSNFNTNYKVYQEDSIILAKKLEETDVVYLDPPYNQHPYGSNYFMLNIIIENKLPLVTSKVSGIPSDWNRSPFNRKSEALNSMEKIIKRLKTKFIIVSYNNEGFISFDEMETMLKKYGKVDSKQIKYNAFRGSRNLNGRDIYTQEYLFLLEKRDWFGFWRLPKK